MIVKTKPLKIKLKESQNPLDDFMSTRNDNKHSITKEVLFVRYIGVPSSIKHYTDDILKMDHCLSSSMSSTPYIRLQGLELIANPTDINRLSSIWDTWEPLVNQSNPYSIYQTSLCAQLEDDSLEWTKKLTFLQVIDMYRNMHTQSSATQIKNFVIKFLYWLDLYLPKLFYSSSLSAKVVFIGNIKQHEIIFLYFLSKLGCDIIYMNPKEDIVSIFPEIEKHSTIYQCSTLYSDNISIPEYVPAPKIVKTTLSQAPKPVSQARKDFPEARMQNLTRAEEYSYEQLASLSSSVVMIKNYDHENNVICYGSGVVIHSKGYILTNLHVVEGGHHFSVLYENETEEYVTDHFIKYHAQHDLAIIKVEKNCSPLTVKTDGHLVRGLKIVAIGSPLGLFNTVSDGIVSGFREIRTMSMIQFTAPISDGSSGGALLDMYGRLVGLITAGFDKGQNLNLAVPSDKIYQFAENFIEHKG